jgi:hypothetical protein
MHAVVWGWLERQANGLVLHTFNHNKPASGMDILLDRLRTVCLPNPTQTSLAHHVGHVTTLLLGTQ